MGKMALERFVRQADYTTNAASPHMARSFVARAVEVRKVRAICGLGSAEDREANVARVFEALRGEGQESVIMASPSSS